QLQVLELHEPGQRGQVGDLVVRQVQPLEVGQFLQGGQVGDLVLGEVQLGQVLALFQAGQVLDALLGGVEHENVGQELLGQLALGVLEGGPQGGFQVLVGNVDGRSRRAVQQQSGDEGGHPREVNASSHG